MCFVISVWYALSLNELLTHLTMFCVTFHLNTGLDVIDRNVVFSLITKNCGKVHNSIKTPVTTDGR